MLALKIVFVLWATWVTFKLINAVDALNEASRWATSVQNSLECQDRAIIGLSLLISGLCSEDPETSERLIEESKPYLVKRGENEQKEDHTTGR